MMCLGFVISRISLDSSVHQPNNGMRPAKTIANQNSEQLAPIGYIWRNLSIQKGTFVNDQIDTLEKSPILVHQKRNPDQQIRKEINCSSANCMILAT